MTRKKTTFNFEKSLADLEKLVEQIEGGELSLEQSLAAFEKGIRITKDCQKALDEAEQKVETLVGDVALDAEEGEDDDEDPDFDL